MKRQAFLCRAKPDGITDLSDQSLRENSLYYGLPDIPGLLDLGHTLESIRLAVRAIHPEYIPLREAKMFWIFSRSMRKGDIVLTPKRLKKETVYYIGEVVGDAYHRPDMAASATAYRRPVRWHRNKLPLHKIDLPSELLEEINAPYNVTKTCLDISNFSEQLQCFIQQIEHESLQEAIDLPQFREDFDQALAKSLADDPETRLARLRTDPQRPEKKMVIAYEFVRNPDVVAEVIARASGRCGRCGSQAPFKRISNGTPYLEVHHIVPLALGGSDSLDNAIALCPNCHRYMHYGCVN